MRGLAPTVLFVLCLIAGCDDSSHEPVATTHEPTPAYPEGTVLAVDGVPITAVEVDRVADWVSVLYPEYTRPHCRRVALTEVLLNLASVRAVYSREYAAAAAAYRELEDEILGATDSLPAAVPAPSRLEGDFQDLSLVLWGFANTLEPGQWSGPLERVGFVSAVRLDGSWNMRGLPQTRMLELSVIDFPYLPAGMTARDLEDLVDQRQLTVVDPEWAQFVPEHWKYRMRGGDQ